MIESIISFLTTLDLNTITLLLKKYYEEGALIILALVILYLLKSKKKDNDENNEKHESFYSKIKAFFMKLIGKNKTDEEKQEIQESIDKVLKDEKKQDKKEGE